MDAAALENKIKVDGFAFLRGADLAGLLGLATGSLPADWDSFSNSWNDLVLDEFMADGGRDRLRRHAVLATDESSGPTLLPRQPHYQSKDYNRLNGGVARWFEPVSPDVANGPTMRATLTFARALFERLRPKVRNWRIELHQFRIEATEGVAGRPTPEGMHRDGVDCVLVFLVRRENVASGTTVVHSVDGAALGSFTLEAPLDAAIVDDARVMHGVTPVNPIDPRRPAYRDVLVVTFASALG